MGLQTDDYPIFPSHLYPLSYTQSFEHPVLLPLSQTSFSDLILFPQIGLQEDGWPITFVHVYPSSYWQFLEQPTPLPLSHSSLTVTTLSPHTSEQFDISLILLIQL